MRKALLWIFLSAELMAAEPPTSEWVHPGADGRLTYKTTTAGDRIMDYSHAGYMGGGVAIPTVAVKQTVSPSGGADETAAIQKAVDAVAVLPLENGFRGTVLLSPGVYPCSGTITLSASGVILRGSGNGTTLELTDKPHNAIAVRAESGQRNRDPAGADFATNITDSYVPSGATSFSVADATGLAAGDIIEIRRPVTEAWTRFMHMDDLVRDGKAQTWIRIGNATTAERKVTAIAGKTVTVDVPLSDSFDAKYLSPPGVTVARIRPSARLSQVGLENLRIKSPPQPFNHTQPHFTAIRMNAEDSWIRDVLIEETMNSVAIGGRRITVQRVAVNRKARHEGSSKPAEFAPNGTQVLLDRCSGSADNVWYVATGAGVSGPIVLLNCDFAGNGRIEAHQRWSTGLLYDNCHVPAGGLEFRNRGSMGSGHGWTMGWGVMWNCEAKDFVVQNPPGAINWMIGCSGENKAMARPFGTEPLLGKGVEDSAGIHVTPQSLYLAQLKERLGAQAIRNLGY